MEKCNMKSGCGMQDSNNSCCHPKGNCCNAKNSCCESNHNCCNKITSNIKCLADKAWGDLLKEKMKKIYEDKMGAKMNELAHVATEAAIKYWQHKICDQASCKEHISKLHKCIFDLHK